MLKADAERECIRLWRELPREQRSTNAHALAFATTLLDSIDLSDEQRPPPPNPRMVAARPAVARGTLVVPIAHRARPITQKVGAVAHSHYVMALYFPTAGKPRRDALRLVVEDDE